jgi:protein-S-isoprenylcysteine O-methyltransferase Ste14
MGVPDDFLLLMLRVVLFRFQFLDQLPAGSYSGAAYMSISQITHKMDIGRLIIVPIFTLLMISNMIVVSGDVKALEPVSAIKVATLINRLLLVCFYALLVFLYFIRSAAKSTTRSFITKTIAVVATFLPFTIPLLSMPSDNLNIMFSANLVTLFGIAIALYSLRVLGGCFSIIPQARKLVQTGPYRLVRHPVYLGELISIFGIVLARPSTSAIAIYCLLAALLIYRALQEEKLLAAVFPEYETYFLTRARFIPGIF